MTCALLSAGVRYGKLSQQAKLLTGARSQAEKSGPLLCPQGISHGQKSARAVYSPSVRWVQAQSGGQGVRVEDEAWATKEYPTDCPQTDWQAAPFPPFTCPYSPCKHKSDSCTQSSTYITNRTSKWAGNHTLNTVKHHNGFCARHTEQISEALCIAG